MGLILRLILLFGVVTETALSYPSCSTDGYRNRCGPEDINELLCLASNCCWDSTSVSDQTRCFQRNAGYKYFSFTVARVDCGRPGIMPHQCVALGCRYHDAPGVPSCFYPNTNIDPEQCIMPQGRIRCGNLFTRQEKCEAMGCCWSPENTKTSNEPWCYYKPDDIERSFRMSAGIKRHFRT